MDFSEIFQQIPIALFSNDSQQLLLSNCKAIIIKQVQTLNTLAQIQFLDLTQVEYSPDSQLIALFSQKRSYIEIRKAPNGSQESFNLPNIIARIEESGIEGIKWAPDSRQLLVWTEFQLKVSIYNFMTRQIAHLRNPKFNHTKGYCFDPSGLFMAFVERKESKDYVGVYSTCDWTLLSYQLVETFDLSNLSWAPDGKSIALWDSEVNYRLFIHCPCAGQLMKYQPYDMALGIKTVEYSSNGQMLAIGSFDEKIRLLNLISLREITEFEHKLGNNKEIIVYKEEEIKDNFVNSKVVTKYISFDSQQFKIQSLKVQPNQANPPQGVGLLAWSYDNAYLASRNDNMPNILWIWDVASLELKFVMVQLSPIKCFKWAYQSQTLILSTGMNKIYFWSPQNTSVCDLPYDKPFNVQRIEWTRDQKCILLFDKMDMLVAFPQIELINNQEEDDFQQ